MNQNLDQHFMTDKSLIKRVIKYSKIKKGEILLEIGPGKGVLTKELAKKAKVIAIEKDSSFKQYLNIPNTRVYFTDAIKYLKTKPKFDKLIANIPYVISEPLLNQLKKINFKLAILTIGKKLADKLIAEKETKLSITMPLFFHIKVLENVPKTSFFPIPRTDSAVIELKPRKRLTKKESIFKDFLSQEDKLARNALKSTLIKHKRLTKNQAKERISSLELNLTKNLKLLSYKEIKKIKEFIFFA